MISCTEFIPLYSEFFKYLDKDGGHDAVMEYWNYLSDKNIGDKTNPNSLGYKCEKFGGFDGARAYWGHTLTEEACDLFEICDNKNRFVYEHMRHCPSRGMLNDLKHIEPYYDYCEHCKVIYSRVLEKYGVVYERDHSKINSAQCSSILYEKGNKPDIDFFNMTDDEIKKSVGTENITVTDLKTEDNKYLHRDFHLLSDFALKYCGDKFGHDTVISFLTDYTKHYYSPQIEKFRAEGLAAIEKWIKHIYEIEEAPDVLQTELMKDRLIVKIKKCPVIAYMRSLNQEPSEYYIEETKTLYSVIAEESGFKFALKYYDTDGKTEFEFREK